MTKIKAAFIHLSLSIVIIGILFSIVYLIWYPKPFFNFSGVVKPFKLLILVDVIIGPILTFIVYKQGKKSLKFDLSVIAIIQLSAMIYGSYIIYSGRPSTVVFNNGQFQYLIEKHAKNEELIYSELEPSLFSKPKMAYIKNFSSLDIYNGYAYFEPLTDYDTMLKFHSLTVENMKAKFKSKITEIDVLEELYKDDEIVFFKLDYKGSTHYVVYSINQNEIIDYLNF